MTRVVLLVLGAIVVIYLIQKYGTKFLLVLDEKAFLDKNQGLEQAAKDKGQKATHSPLEFDSYASKIYNSHGFWNDDEQSVGAVFQTLHNELDVSLLIKAFGIKDGMALAGFLYDFLNSSEIEEYVNAPLRGNGVKVQF